MTVEEGDHAVVQKIDTRDRRLAIIELVATTLGVGLCRRWLRAANYKKENIERAIAGRPVRCDDEQTGQSRKQGNGLLKSLTRSVSPITPCRPMAWRWPRSDITSQFFGIGSSVGVAREHDCYGRR